MVDNIEHVGGFQKDTHFGTIKQRKDKPTQCRKPIRPMRNTIPITSMKNNMEISSNTHHRVSKSGGVPVIPVSSIVTDSLLRKEDEKER